jgi:hypothetical protein
LTSPLLNCTCRYASPVHAERAAGQHGTLLNADTLLSVLVLSPRLAQHLGIELNPDGSLRVEHCGDRVSQPMPTPAQSSSTPAGESDALWYRCVLLVSPPGCLTWLTNLPPSGATTSFHSCVLRLTVALFLVIEAGLGGGLRQRSSVGFTSSVKADRPEEQGLLDEPQQQRGGDSLRQRGSTREERRAEDSRALRSAAPDLYLQPRRRKNLCERIVEYFFSY